MKELFVSYAAYNVWAHQQLFAQIENLTEEQLHQEVQSSFPSIFKTVLHLWDAENIWWQRVKLQEHIIRPSENFNGDIKTLTKNVLQQSRQWQEWVNGITQTMLQHEFKYQDSKRESFKQPVYQMLLHLFNHGTYHRGQLVTLLRQCGVTQIPNTDFMGWLRRSK